MLDLLKVLRDLEQIETKMAELYEWLAERFADDGEAAELFRHLRMMEISHQNILRYESRIVRGNPRAFREVVLDAEMLNRTLEAIDHFRQSDPQPTLEEAVKAALAFDAGAAELYYIAVFHEAARDFADFVKNLHTGSRTHFDKLHKFASRWRIDLPPGTAPPGITIPPIPSRVVPAKPQLSVADRTRRP